MSPIVDGLEQAYSEQIVVQRINADKGEGPAIMRQYRILGHPTLLIFDSQPQEIHRLMGPQSAQVIEELLSEVLNVQP